VSTRPNAASLLALLSIAAATACGSSSSNAETKLKSPMPASELAAYQACAGDQDCVWFTNGCCDCANGGVETAVARNRHAELKARFDCANVPCTSRGREVECGTGTVACANARCVFVPASEAQ
jgi:hypothetical protein